jgi:colicin import membrane protein
VPDTLPSVQTSLRPPSRDNPRLGVLMSALAHAGLITALTLGVHWRNEEPAGVEAELWAATPQIAAPRAEAPPEPVKVEPPPPPPPAVAKPTPAPAPPPPDTAQRDAQIALEKAREAKLEKARQDAADQRARDKRLKDAQATKQAQEQQARLDKEQREKERQDKLKAEQADKRKQELAKQQQAEKTEKAEKAAQAEAQRLKDQREAQLRRMTEQLGGTGAANSTGSAARDAGPSAGYAGRIKARIKPNIVLTDEVSGNPVAEVEVRVAPDGTIIGRRIVKSSGLKSWDETVLRAIDRTAILPRDTNGRVEPTMIISFRPYE